MRGLDGRLVADLNDNLPAEISGSTLSPATSSLNENLTTYVLLPELVNQVPYISQSIYNTSTPLIKPIQHNRPGLTNLFIDANGTVRVLVGTSFKLKMKAAQPPIYNIENGKPTLIVEALPPDEAPPAGVPVTTGSLESTLQYEWTRDGNLFLRATDPNISNALAFVTGSRNDELIFQNISPTFAGTYVCEASNDIGAIESELVTIEVFNPDIDDLFYNNLVQNPYGKNDLDGWLTPDSDFITARLTDAPFKKLSQPWNKDIFGYSVDMLYPRPYHLNTYHIKNSNFLNDILDEGYYFTRERIKYKAKDGRALINAEYDVDLTDAQPYIQGAVYGVDGVRAIFGAYVGNAISRYKTTIVNAIIDYRNLITAVDPSTPRPTLENSLLAGPPVLDEEVTVVVTEYDNERPLLSRLLNVSSSVVTEVPGCIIHDPWTKAMMELDSQIQQGLFIQLMPSGSSPTGFISLGNTQEEKILYAISSGVIKYPNLNFIPSYGQYAEFNKVVVDKLNFRTNKIRISLNFTAKHDVLNDTTGELLDASDDCFELLPYELIIEGGRFPHHFPNDFYQSTINNVTQLVSVLAFNKFAYKGTKSLQEYFALMGISRSLITGLNLVLLPIETNNSQKLDYYTKTILEPNINGSVFTEVQSSVMPLTPLGQYLNSLQGYQNKFIGVQVTNQWIIPYKTYRENLDISGVNYQVLNHNLRYGQNKITSTTAVSTFQWVSNPDGIPGEYIEMADYLNNGSFNWAATNLSDLVQDIQAGNVDIIYKTGSSEDVRQSALPDVLYTMEAGVFNFITNGLVFSVPGRFVSESNVNTQDYLRNVGFNVDLAVKKHGYPTASNDPNDVYRAWKEPDPTWPANLTKVRHKHNLLQLVDQDYIVTGTSTSGTGSVGGNTSGGTVGSSVFSALPTGYTLKSFGIPAVYTRFEYTKDFAQYTYISESFVLFKVRTTSVDSDLEDIYAPDDQAPYVGFSEYEGAYVPYTNSQNEQYGPDDDIQAFTWVFSGTAYEAPTDISSSYPGLDQTYYGPGRFGPILFATASTFDIDEDGPPNGPLGVITDAATLGSSLPSGGTPIDDMFILETLFDSGDQNYATAPQYLQAVKDAGVAAWSPDIYYGIVITTSSVSFYAGDLSTPIKVIPRDNPNHQLRLIAMCSPTVIIEDLKWGPYDSSLSIEDQSYYTPVQAQSNPGLNGDTNPGGLKAIPQEY